MSAILQIEQMQAAIFALQGLAPSAGLTALTATVTAQGAAITALTARVTALETTIALLTTPVAAKFALAGPLSGSAAAPVFRQLVAADIGA